MQPGKLGCGSFLSHSLQQPFEKVEGGTWPIPLGLGVCGAPPQGGQVSCARRAWPGSQGGVWHTGPGVQKWQVIKLDTVWLIQIIEWSISRTRLWRQLLQLGHAWLSMVVAAWMWVFPYCWEWREAVIVILLQLCCQTQEREKQPGIIRSHNMTGNSTGWSLPVLRTEALRCFTMIQPVAWRCACHQYLLSLSKISALP